MNNFEDKIKEVKTTQNDKDYTIRYVALSDIMSTEKLINGNKFYIIETFTDDDNKRTSIIVDKDLVTQLIKNPAQLFNLSHTQDNPIFLVKKEFLHNVQRYGRLTGNYLRQLDGKEKYKEHEVRSYDVLHDINNPDFTLVQYSSSKHMTSQWTDPNGYIYSEPFRIDHRSARLDNAKYFLDELAEHLSKLDNISFITHTGRFDNKPSKLLHAPLKDDEEDIGGIINDIEHHLEENEERPSETEEISIMFYPTQKDLELINSWNPEEKGYSAEERHNETFNVERFILQKILGAENFLKHPYSEESQPKRKFKH